MAFGKLKTSTRIIVFLVSVGLIFALLLFKQWRSEQLERKAVGSNASVMYDQIRENAKANQPDKPLSDAMRDEAIKLSAKSLSEKSGDDKSLAAAGQYLGYYLVNVKSRYEFCNSLGVDITPFVTAFKAENEKFYEKSRAIVARRGFSNLQEIEDLHLKNSSVIYKVISDDMGNVAKAKKMTVKDVCGLYRTKGAELAAFHKLSNRNPYVYKVLLEAK